MGAKPPLFHFMSSVFVEKIEELKNALSNRGMVLADMHYVFAPVPTHPVTLEDVRQALMNGEMSVGVTATALIDGDDWSLDDTQSLEIEYFDFQEMYGKKEGG